MPPDGDSDQDNWPDPGWLKWEDNAWTHGTVLEENDNWVSDDNTIATTKAGDDRWLNAGGAGGTLDDGPGITFDTSVADTTKIQIDLHGTDPGLELDPAGDAGQLRVLGNSVTQTGGNDADPNLTNGPSDVQFVGGANTTIERDGANTIRISSSGGTGLTYRGQLNITTTGAASALPNASENDVYGVNTTGTITADWQAVITGAATTTIAGDLLRCSTAAGGTPANARYTLINSGTPPTGDITGVTAGDGLTGGGNTGEVTLDVGAGAGITANANDVAVRLEAAGAGTGGLAFDNNEIRVDAGNGIELTANGVAVQAANNTISVAAGGISVNAANLPPDASRVAVAGDTMTGTLQMDGASVIADNGETVPDNSGNWDIQDSNVWQVPSGRTIDFPDDTAAPIPGQTGIFVCAGTVAGWDNDNGGTWEHPGGTAQAGDANGAIIPFYVQSATRIILGTQTVGS